ncbi:MAG: bacterial transcriptional activator domain-containing protein [Nitrospirota bacterium]
MITNDPEESRGTRRKAMKETLPQRKSWPLEIYMLGHCEIRVEGVALLKRRKTPHRLLELLQVIVASGGAAVPVSYLIDQLWPESDGDRAVATFSKTLKRLRKYLAVERVIHLEHGPVTLDSTRCWVDVCAFEQGVARSEHLISSVPLKGWMQELQQALALYHGPFLLDQRLKPWAVAIRERLRECFVKGVARLSDHWQRLGRLEQAIQWLNRGLQVDPHAAPLYGPLITLLSATGRKTEAAVVYHQCARVFVKELGRPIPQAVQHLYKNVLS